MVRIVKGIYRINTDSLLEKINKVIVHLKMKGDITIKLSDREESKALNFQYRKKDYPTDVLSFPINEEFPDSYYIGDILICFPIVKEQAILNKISIDKEFFTLSCHGILHLAGYDHETDSGEMLDIQDNMIKKYYKE